MKTLAELFDRAAAAGTPVIAGDGTVTAAEIAAEAARVAGALRELGVRRGDRVAAWLPNLPQSLSLYAACGRLGAILVAVNTRFGAAEIADVVGRSEARVLVAATAPGDAGLAPLPDVQAASIRGLRHLVVVGAPPPAEPLWPHVENIAYDQMAAAPAMTGCDGGGSDLANIFTTSGTTSAPKFAAHRQDAVVGHACDVARTLEFGMDGAVSLQLLPFCGVFGFVQALAALAAPAPIVMPPAIDAEAAVGLARRHRATHLFASDDLIHRMLEAAPEARPFPDLRYCLFAGFNTWLTDLPARAEARGVPMIAPFGMSEVFAIFAARPADARHPDKHRAGGTLVNGEARVRVRDPETGDLLGDGETAELEISSPHMFAGYFGDPDATAAAMTPDGYLRTGDLGYTEPGNAFTYLQRIGDTLRLGGFLVAPAEIEAAVVAHPAVADAQVVAAGTAAGNRPVAFVIAATGGQVDEADVIAHCRGRLPKFKTPVRVAGIEAFPVTHGPNGTKVQRKRLRRMAEELLAEP
ncbi:MAG: AMP-binding protein [Magnetovibrio sp.]|nr:AMP-binding protein [Magnetovibrio sp.]